MVRAVTANAATFLRITGRSGSAHDRPNDNREKQSQERKPNGDGCHDDCLTFEVHPELRTAEVREKADRLGFRLGGFVAARPG